MNIDNCSFILTKLHLFVSDNHWLIHVVDTHGNMEDVCNVVDYTQWYSMISWFSFECVTFAFCILMCINYCFQKFLITCIIYLALSIQNSYLKWSIFTVWLNRSPTKKGSFVFGKTNMLVFCSLIIISFNHNFLCILQLMQSYLWLTGTRVARSVIYTPRETMEEDHCCTVKHI